MRPDLRALLDHADADLVPGDAGVQELIGGFGESGTLNLGHNRFRFYGVNHQTIYVMSAGLIVFGFLAAEAADGMRDREPWAYVVGIVLAVVGAIGSVMAETSLTPPPWDLRQQGLLRAIAPP